MTRFGTPAWFDRQFSGADGPAGDAWGHRWRGSQRYRHTLSLDLLRPTLPRGGTLEILDIGCAVADFTARVQALCPGSRTTAVDLVPRAVEIVRRQHPGLRAAAAALPRLPFPPGIFDLVIALEVLYYLPPEGRREGVREIHRLLRPGGRILFSGQLDGGVKYHSREELRALFDRDFEIEATRYVHTRAYYFMEGWMLRCMRNLQRASSRFSSILPSRLSTGNLPRLAGRLIEGALAPEAVPAFMDRVGSRAMGSKG